MRIFFKKRWYFLILIIVIAFIFFLNQKTTIRSQVKKNNSYIVKRQELKDNLSIAGQIEAEERVVLQFQTSGMLAWVGVKKGDYVRKYQGIASLDQKELERNLKKYLNTFKSERWDFDQTKEDYKNKAITEAMQRVIDKNQFDLDSSIIDVELKNIALQYAYLYAPIEGIVIRIDSPFPGVNITPSGAEFEIVNPKTVYFSANADQTEVVKLKENIQGVIALDAYSDRKLFGNVYQVSFIPKQGETGTVYEVKMKLDNDNLDYKYKLGMTGDATFDFLLSKNALMIPSSFIKVEKKKKYVWKEENGKKVKSFVQIGQEVNNETEITSGLKEGDIIYD